MRMTFGRLAIAIPLLCAGIIPGLMYLGYVGITDNMARTSAVPEIRARALMEDAEAHRSGLSIQNAARVRWFFTSIPGQALLTLLASFALFSVIFGGH